MRQMKRKGMLRSRRSSVFTSTYEENNREASDDEEMDKGEWIKSKQCKKTEHWITEIYNECR